MELLSVHLSMFLLLMVLETGHGAQLLVLELEH
jgi:hypothetical protein